MPVNVVADAQERQRALDPSRSFLVQAPAGSGKTELLIQRYLTLLARVTQPESVLAITFTRKAASEMQARVLKALADAAGPAPESAHDRHTWELARAVWQRDQAHDWNLRANPSRLRIQTIDAFCAALTRQMPWLARFGAQPEATEDATPLYREAARRTLALVEQEDDQQRPWADAIALVLRHLDNQWGKLEDLLIAMLRTRDQWLRHILDRDSLEATLHRTVEGELAQLAAAFPEDACDELLALVRYATNNLNDPLHPCRDLAEWPGSDPAEHAPIWQGLASVLLTTGGTWRKKLDKNGGFPPGAPGKLYKERMEALLARLSAVEGLEKRLADCRRLPSCEYAETQISIIDALATMLPLAVAQLDGVFREEGAVDFTEVSLRALKALGTEQEPTDLTMRLDARIEHILVDEFQDTSLSQYALLHRLTAEWQPGDGRTLFCVGDPMQSIYRFRQAEVGLFLQAHERGIGHLTLEFVRLSVNFRSAAGIVEWVNHAFDNIFPSEQDIALGAVPYSHSTAFHPPGEHAPVSIHPFCPNDEQGEAARVVELIQEARERRPEGTVAILVRARTHLSAIVQALKGAGLRFRAVDIDQLGERTLIQDLLALTRALLHLADRPAWLALLRAPWCGLTLADLVTIAGDDHQTTIWDLLERNKSRLDPDAQTRVERLQETLIRAFAERHRLPLRAWVQGVWLALGGPACLENEAGVADAADFFDLLADAEQGGDLPDLATFTAQATALFAQPDPHASDNLQVMTIHKAKGLQFDTVIVPGLGRGKRYEEPSLMLWAERPSESGENELLIAPIQETGGDKDPLYEYLRRWDAQKGELEEARLLYVAATRAKQELHLLGHIKEDTPAKGSLLKHLWDVIGEHFAAVTRAGDEEEEEKPPALAAPMQLRRLPLDWTLPAPPPAVRWSPEYEPVEGSYLSFRWVGETLRHVGTVVHRLLQRIGRPDAPLTSESTVVSWRPWIASSLKKLGVPAAELEAAVERTLSAVVATLRSERGQWIFAPHIDTQCEFALTGLVDGRIEPVVVDRTFLDEYGTRWIIDFKTSDHQGGGLERFLDDQQERYRAQLEGYAALLRQFDDRHPIRLALYFPLLDGWREWPAPARPRLVTLAAR